MRGGPLRAMGSLTHPRADADRAPDRWGEPGTAPPPCASNTGAMPNHSRRPPNMPRNSPALAIAPALDRPLPFDAPRLENAVREMLIAIGEDPDREGLLDTPARVARSWAELFGGLREDPAEHLARTFTQDSADLVTLRDIEFESFCEHHLLPVFGRAHIAYLPSDRRVVGLSKLARTVEVFAR